MTVLSVIHECHAARNTVGHYGSGNDYSVTVETFDPVVVNQSGFFCIFVVHPDCRATSEQRQHRQRIIVHTVDRPLIMRCQVVQDNLLSPFDRTFAVWMERCMLQHRFKCR
ncbi:hypothetical protein D3C76_1325400 [compost metagenome]